MRSGYFYGDLAVSQAFFNLAEAAGNALLTIPDSLLSRLPEDIRELCRPQKNIIRRYLFGTVADPDQTRPSSFHPWMAIVATLKGGVVVYNPETPTGSDNRASVWTLLLHRLGWKAEAGSSLRATRWNWAKVLSVPIGEDPGPFFQRPIEIPRTRFYSILGTSRTDTTDICWASVWAIDRLLAWFGPVPIASQAPIANSARPVSSKPISKTSPGRSFQVIRGVVGDWSEGSIFTEYEFRRKNPAPAPNPGDDPAIATTDYYEELYERLLNLKVVKIV